jgi:type VI secretion system protein ImpK
MRLTDAFMELFAYTAYFKSRLAQEQPSYESVRNDLLRLVARCDEFLSSKDIPPEDATPAKFAVFAWIDETILTSQWQHKGRWSADQLQKQFFNINTAGEEFFERLNMLSPGQNHVREIFYLCLVSGFTGRFHNKGDEILLDQLKTSNLKFITGSSVSIPSMEKKVLFPEAYPAEVTRAAQKSRRYSWLTLGLALFPIVLFLSLYGLATFGLDSMSDNFLTRVFQR